MVRSLEKTINFDSKEKTPSSADFSISAIFEPVWLQQTIGEFARLRQRLLYEVRSPQMKIDQTSRKRSGIDIDARTTREVERASGGTITLVMVKETHYRTAICCKYCEMHDNVESENPSWTYCKDCSLAFHYPCAQSQSQ